MIQPLTVVTFVLACSSGLYLYQSKHEVQLLDRTIERAVHETGALREQSRLLAAEWTIQNDPERLRRFSNTYLNLKTITPSQFTSLADLGNRLPSPRAEATPQSPDEQDVIPVGPESLPSVPEAASEPIAAPAADEVLPVPPMPAAPQPPVAAVPVTASTAHAADVRAAVTRPAAVESPPHTIVSEARSSEVHFAEARSSESRASEQRVARNADGHGDMRSATGPSSTMPSPAVPGFAAVPPKPIVLAAPKSSPAATQSAAKAPAPLQPPAPSRPAVIATSEPVTGSLLGMAHTSAPSPVPRPTPVVATYNAN